jgi:hypothetical protein
VVLKSTLEVTGTTDKSALIEHHGKGHVSVRARRQFSLLALEETSIIAR